LICLGPDSKFGPLLTIWLTLLKVCGSTIIFLAVGLSVALQSVIKVYSIVQTWKSTLLIPFFSRHFSPRTTASHVMVTRMSPSSYFLSYSTDACSLPPPRAKALLPPVEHIGRRLMCSHYLATSILVWVSHLLLRLVGQRLLEGGKYLSIRLLTH